MIVCVFYIVDAFISQKFIVSFWVQLEPFFFADYKKDRKPHTFLWVMASFRYNIFDVYLSRHFVEGLLGFFPIYLSRIYHIHSHNFMLSELFYLKTQVNVATEYCSSGYLIL